MDGMASEGTALVPAGELVDHQVPRDPRARKQKPRGGTALLSPEQIAEVEAERAAEAAAAAAETEAQAEARRAAEKEAQQKEREAQEMRFLKRAIAIEEEKRACAADLADLRVEIADSGLDPAAIGLAVKRHFESQEQRKLREARELAADQMVLNLGL